MAKVSIIVPIYNVEKYLDRCIDSLINQTLKDIEIILVDDGSPDKCPEICDKYADLDKRIKVIHKKNGGVSAARNDGLSAASGDWVIFCDSDDWMEKDACEILYSLGEEKGVDIAIGDINLIRGEEAVYNRFFADEFVYRNKKDMTGLVMADIYQNYCPNPPSTHTIGYGGPWNKLVKRQFLLDNKIKFDTSLLGIFDDILYTAYIYANADSIAYIQKPVYNYVVISTSITKSYKANTLEISRRIFKAFGKFKSEYAPDGKLDRAYDALVVRRFDEALRLYFFSEKNPKKLKDRLKELKETMKEEPYVSATRNAEYDKLLSYHRRVAVFIKMKSAVGLWLLYFLKKLFKRV
ncbi:MAG: glycosyltransferase family 2 protein [Clostridiales bacterium]|nr:glycosyltransferase family 2 protein [Clostridiales bacterium]